MSKNSNFFLYFQFFFSWGYGLLLNNQPIAEGRKVVMNIGKTKILRPRTLKSVHFCGRKKPVRMRKYSWINFDRQTPKYDAYG
ncbi:unnamed protein product, partial [Nesidiocoris tenuis]